MCEEVLLVEAAAVVEECMATVAAVKSDLQMTLIKAVLKSGEESMQPVDTSGKVCTIHSPLLTRPSTLHPPPDPCSRDLTPSPTYPYARSQVFLYRGNFNDLSFEERRRAKARAKGGGGGESNGTSSSSLEVPVVTLSQPVATYHVPLPLPVQEWTLPFDASLGMRSFLDNHEDRYVHLHVCIHDARARAYAPRVYVHVY